jgi:hypothetical protein
MTIKSFRNYLDILSEVQLSEETSSQNNTQPNTASLAQRYTNWAKENPKTKLALDLFPPTAIASSAADTVSQAAQGQYGDAAVSAIGLIPIIKPLSKLASLGKSPRELKVRDAVSRASKGAYGVDAAIDTAQAVNQEIKNVNQVPDQVRERQEKYRLLMLAGIKK